MLDDGIHPNLAKYKYIFVWSKFKAADIVVNIIILKILAIMFFSKAHGMNLCIIIMGNTEQIKTWSCSSLTCC